MGTPRYTAPYSSRDIYRDGKPFITIGRASPVDDSYVSPTDVDEVSREILRLLNGEAR